MSEKNFHTSITVNAPAHEAFQCINSVSRWWTENLEGESQDVNDEFTVRFGDVHVSKQKLVEVVPDKKVVWLIADSKLNFVKNKQEWTNTKVSFEISAQGNKTTIRFTHLGLDPDQECFDACSNAWNEYIQESLLSLINTGKGKPSLKER